MEDLVEEEERSVKEHLLSFSLGHSVSEHILGGVAVIPLEPLEIRNKGGRFCHILSI